MLHLDRYDTDTKKMIAQRVNDCAAALGGLGRLLDLVETIKSLKPLPLQNKTASFHFRHGKVSWDKVLFSDKVETFSALIQKHDAFENLLKTGTKKEQNAVRTFYPVTFTVTPLEGEPFTFRAVHAPNKETAHVDPLFELLFFASTGLIKKALKEAS